MSTLTTQQKLDILASLQLASDNKESIWHLGIKKFVEDSHKKTDADYICLVQYIQSQIEDSERLMKILLADQFDFFNDFFIGQAINPARCLPQPVLKSN